MSELGNKTIMAMNIKRFLALSGKNQKELCKDLGFRESTFSDWVNAKTYPRIDKIELMAKYFNVTKADLVEEARLYSPHPSLAPAKYKKFKVLGDIACGQPIEEIQQVEEFIETELNVHADFVLHCKGDSMINARIFNGDYVFIKEQPEVENGEIAAVEMDGTVTLKRFYRYDEYIELRAENPTYKPIIIHQTDFDSIRVLGKAVACQCFVE